MKTFLVDFLMIGLVTSFSVTTTTPSYSIRLHSHRPAVRRSFVRSIVVSLVSAIPLIGNADEREISPTPTPPPALSYERLSAKGGRQMASLIKSRAKSNSIYDFPIVVSIDGVSKKLSIREYFQTTGLNQLPKALLISNMKEDDPSSRLSIPQFIDLTTEFPSLCVILIPTDQGYFEPDTSDLIRAKLNKEYGFGGYGKDNNKNSKYQQQVVTDKIDWLGKPSLEFVTGWLEDVLPSPTDNSRGVRGNYEKFLVDGRSGLPVRRYPKGYEPRLIGKDLKTLLGGNDFDFDEGLGPASSDWLEWWRMEIESSKSDTYRFQKGLNYFDY